MTDDWKKMQYSHFVLLKKYIARTDNDRRYELIAYFFSYFIMLMLVYKLQIVYTDMLQEYKRW